MIDNAIYCVISWFTILLSMVSFIRFYPEKHRDSKIADILMWSILALVTVFEAWDLSHGFILWPQIVLYGVLNAAILKLFFNCSYLSALLWLWLYNICLSMAKLPFLTAMGIQQQARLDVVNVGERGEYGAIEISLVLLYIACHLCFQYHRQIRTFMKFLMVRRGRSYIFLFAEVVTLYIVNAMMHLGDIRFEQKDMILNLFYLMSATIGFALCMVYMAYEQKKTEQRSLMEQQKLLAKENDMIKEYCRQDAKRLHDLKHTFMYLQECMEHQKYDLAKCCVDEHLEEVKCQQKQVWTGIENIDFILNYKYHQIRQRSIKFRLDAEVYQEPDLSGEHLMIVLGNTLDNAIEAVQKCPLDVRAVFLTIKNVNEMFVIRIRNSCLQKTAEQNGTFRTEKENSIYHGWGLENVRHIVEESGGELHCEYENGWFVTTILLKGKETHI